MVNCDNVVAIQSHFLLSDLEDERAILSQNGRHKYDIHQHQKWQETNDMDFCR